MTVSGSQEALFERLCDQFEANWKRDHRPRIEEYVDRVGSTLKRQLFVELVGIDVAKRRQVGESPQVEEYCARFPDYADLIRHHEEFHVEAPPPTRMGDYRIEEQIGEGGMGIVYRATHEILNKTVALKVLPSDPTGRDALRRFRKEIHAIASLEHEHIVRATDAGESRHGLYLVMEYVEGVDASRLVRENGPLPLEVACEIIRQTALGLQNIHEHHLVHRDIKPSNVMLSVSGNVKILDLGLVRNIDVQPGDLTRSGQVMGTIDYLAPEQANDSSKADIRADIYSLGCTLFHLLCGRPPYGHPDHGTVARLVAHASAEIPSIEETRGDCPASIEAIFRRMVAKEPADRFSHPREVAEQLEGACRPSARDSLQDMVQTLVETRARRRTRPDDAQPDDTLPEVTTEVIPCPFPGLRAFSRDEKDVFFGREEHIEQLADKLNRFRFLAVVGPSGCGKSSMVLAGLLPHLEDGFVEGAGPHWRETVMRPGDAPFRRLATALLADKALGKERGSGPRAEEVLEATLRRGPWGLADALNETGLEPGTNMVVVIDQFEELFRFHQSSVDRPRSYLNDTEAFVNVLLTPTRHPDRDQRLSSLAVYVVVTMRWDFLDEQFCFSGLSEAMNDSVFFTPRLTRDQCEMAIVGPARVREWEIDRVLVNRLLNDTATEPDQLPLLQHTLMRMWTKAAKDIKGTLTLDDYEGSPEISLSNHANEVFDAVDENCQQITRKMFQLLADRGESAQVTRRPVTLKEVAEIAGVEVAVVRKVADRFRHSACSFLTPPETVPLEEETVLDISHECLLRKWDRMEHWMEEESQAVNTYRRLLKAARAWQSGQSDRPFLGIDEVLEWMQTEHPNEAWAERYGGSFELVQSFIEHCQRRQSTRRRDFDFDAFLCHSPEDKPTVRDIAEKLKQREIQPWLDDWELPPGKTWQHELQRQVDRIACAVIFVGPQGDLDWQRPDMQQVLQAFIDRDRPVIPVILPGAGRELPMCLRGLTCVDFRTTDPDPMYRLIWGITGERPG